MKHLSVFTLVLAIFLIFTACDNEPVDSAIDIATINQGPTPVVLDCSETTQALDIATENLSNSDESNYTFFCDLYREALQNQIEACGDLEGLLQELIDGLGSCSYDETDCYIRTNTVQIILVSLNMATQSNYSTICNTYKGALQNQIEACGDDDGSIQDSIDELGDCSW